MELKVISKRGMSIRELSRTMGVSRNTVRRYLRGASRTRETRTLGSKLEPYKGYLVTRIAQAKPDWIAATVLQRELVERGYTGGVALVKRFIRQFKSQPKADPVVRFETAPGVQLQADFVVFRRGREPLLAFVATLGYSRATFVRFTTDERSETVLSCLVEAFEYFGGVPHEVLFDNAKSVVLTRHAYGHGRHRFHPALLALANEVGFVPRLCRPYRAKTKGKVERFNRYLREQFYVPLMTQLRAVGLVLDATTANVEVARWLREVANARTHSTTGLVPAAQLVIERAALLALPRVPLSSPPLPASGRVPLPFESLQHPLSVYSELVVAV